MSCILKHACPSHQKNEATRSSLEDKPLWSMKLCPCLGGSHLTPLTACSIVPCLSFDWWSFVLVWWCLVLWPCLIRSLSWLLVYCGSSTYNDISCLVGFFFLYLPSPWHPSISLPDQMKDTKRGIWSHHRCQQANATAFIAIKKQASWRKEDSTLAPCYPIACYSP